MPGEGGRNTRQRYVYSVLSGGFTTAMPYGLQAPFGENPPSKMLLDAQNVIWHRGALRNAWHWTRLDKAAHVNPPIDGNIASRQETANTNAQYPVDALIFSTSSANQQAYVLLTDGEVFVNGVSMNPTYSTGTSTYTGTGTGTAWSARGIKAGDLFKLDSDSIWRVITAVNSDTSITLESNPGSGSGTYKIRRTFTRTHIPGMASMTLLNGDLYVACLGGGEDPGATETNWCVLKVADIFGTPTEAVYVLAGWDITGALATKSILTGITRIAGIQATEEGRIVIAASQDGAGNRVIWSSNSATDDWNAEDANYNDLVPSRGEIRAFTRLGKSLVAYFVDSIHVGVPTTDTLFPFTWSRSQSSIGTRWYRAACESPDGNLFVGSDGNFYLFNGSNSQLLTDETVHRWTRGADEEFFLEVAVSPLPAIVTFSASIGSVTVA